MPSHKISQREARKLKKRVDFLSEALLHQRRSWSQQWLGGTEIVRTTSPNSDDPIPQSIRVAIKLGHAVVVLGDHTGLIRFIALPHPKELL